jgi:hypothetical protein
VAPKSVTSDGLTAIRFVPPVTVRETRPMRLPPGYQILIANSSHKAIKNKEERRLFNAGIFAYRFALLYLREAVAKRRRDLGLTIDPDGIRFLADMNVERFPLATIYQLLLAVPDTVSPRELMMRYPESYEPSALACFGTADCDQLPAHIPIRGAAIYGLGRVDRGLAMHELCARGDEGRWASSGGSCTPPMTAIGSAATASTSSGTRCSQGIARASPTSASRSCSRPASTAPPARSSMPSNCDGSQATTARASQNSTVSWTSSRRSPTYSGLV